MGGEGVRKAVGEESRRCESAFTVSVPAGHQGARWLPRLAQTRRKTANMIRHSFSLADEDFTTIDWVADTLLERSRRRYEAATATRTLGHSLKAGFWRVVEAGQSWGVVSLVGESCPPERQAGVALCVLSVAEEEDARLVRIRG